MGDEKVDQDRMTHTQRGGFALVVALVLMSFLVLLLLSLSTLTRVEVGLGSSHRQTAAARTHALYALDLALAQLQQTAGPDRRVTARAEIMGNDINPYWTGVWESGATDQPPVWLVSGNGRDLVERDLSVVMDDYARVLGAGSAGSDPAQHVFAPKVPLMVPDVFGDLGGPTNVAAQGHYAYWIADEGVKVSIDMTDRTAEVPLHGQTAAARRRELSNLRQQIPSRPTWQRMFSAEFEDSQREPDELSEGSLLPEALAKLETKRQAEVLPAFPAVLARDRYHDWTVGAAALLTNTATGGLRANLSNASYTDDLITADVQDFLNLARGINRVSPDPRKSPLYDASTGRFAVSVGTQISAGGQVFSIAPIVTEVLVRAGLFANRDQAALTKQDIRLRFFAEIELWNPYAFPLKFPETLEEWWSPHLEAWEVGYPAGRLVLQNLPSVTITATGSMTHQITAYPLDDAQRSRDGEGNVASWVEIVEGRDRVFPSTSWRSVLMPGEVYRRKEPEAISQPNGLARTLAPTLRMRNTDAIDVELTQSDEGVHFHFMPYVSDPRGGYEINDVFFELLHVPFVSSRYDYAQANGGTYPFVVESQDWREEYLRFAYGFRLNPDFVGVFLQNLDPRRVSWDMRETIQGYDGSSIRVSDLFEVMDHDPVELASLHRTAFSEEFFHGDIQESDGEHRRRRSYRGDYRLFDLPTGERDSLAILRWYPATIPTAQGGPTAGPMRDAPLAMGWPTAADADDPTRQNIWNTAFDRYFFSTLEAGEGDWSVGSGQPLRNHHLRLTQPATVTRAQLEAADAAQHLFLAAAFNLNSTSVAAWRAMLFPAVQAYRGDAWDQPHGREDVGNLFSRFTQGDDHLGTAQPEVGFLPDAEMSDDALIITTAWDNDLPFSQGVRSLTDATADALATAFVEKIRLRGKPFGSWQELIESNVVQEAIDATDINAGLELPGFGPALFAPAYLSQAEVLLRLAPIAQVRSDTFRIRVYGDAVQGTTGHPRVARAWGEAVVQRTVEKVSGDDPMTDAPATDPRRFTVLSFRWLTAEEI